MSSKLNFNGSLGGTVKDFLRKFKPIVIIVVAMSVVLVGSSIYGIINKPKEKTAVTVISDMLNNRELTGDINLLIGDAEINLEYIQNGTKKALSMSSPKEYTPLMYSDDDGTLLNSSVSDVPGFLSMNKEAKESSIELPDFPSDGITFSRNDDGEYVLSVSGDEDWKTFCNSMSTYLTENADNLAYYYADNGLFKEQVLAFAETLASWAKGDVAGSGIKIVISKDSESDVTNYSGSFDIKLNFSYLPEYIDQNYFDSALLLITGKFNFDTTESVIDKPSGANRNASSEKLSSYFESLWASLFTNKKYKSLDEVTASSGVVTVKRNLGAITEVGTFVYGTDGLENGSWEITVPDENVFNIYVKKLGKDKITYEKQGDNIQYIIKYTVSEAGLKALRLYGETSEDLCRYFQSAKGSDLIV